MNDRKSEHATSFLLGNEAIALAALEAGIHFAYAGNVPGHPSENTICPGCGHVLIKRDGYYIEKNTIRHGQCPKCKRKIAGRWN